MEAQPFNIFGTYHLVTLVVILSLAIFFPRAYRDKPASQKENVAKILGISIITLELIKPFLWHSMDYPWIKLMPIHMCSLSGFFIGIFQNLKKIGYFVQPNSKKIAFRKITSAFQRHFRKELINGLLDMECLKISINLAKKYSKNT